MRFIGEKERKSSNIETGAFETDCFRLSQSAGFLGDCTSTDVHTFWII